MRYERPSIVSREAIAGLLVKNGSDIKPPAP